MAVGHVGFFSGVIAPITGNMPKVLKAWAQDLNARGGLACHPVTVYSADDGGDPARSAYLVQDMVERHGVVAFVAPVVTTPAGFLQAIAAAKVPAVGGPGFKRWRENPWVFLESAAVVDQVFGLIRNGVQQGKRKVGLIHCVEIPECTEVAGYFETGAPAASAELVYSAPASVTQVEYTGACLNARNAGVDQLAVFLDGASIGRLARSCDAVGYRPLLASLAGLISPGQAADPLVRKFGLATATGNAPWTQKDTPGLRDYHRVLARWTPGTPPDGASIITFTAAKLLEAALSHVAAEVARGQITSELVLRGLGNIRNESLGGLTVGLTFRPGQRGSTSSGCVFLELLTSTGWTAPNGSRSVCRPASGGTVGP
ncbi:MAG: ABC transporter substrate-binding protein [Sporichthyaceae bacterium]